MSEENNLQFQNSLEFAIKMDNNDDLKEYRNLFYIPKIEDKECIYFTGNSLGLQPKSCKEYIDQELNDWANLGVEGHFLAKRNWFGYHHFATEKLAKIVGAKEIEVVAMNTLSVNLNLLMVSFYRPNGNRKKIVIEENAFPSDLYAVQQQIKFHGGNIDEDIIYVKPNNDTQLIEIQTILDIIEKNSDYISLILLGGVNYYNGQLFDMKKITSYAHKYDIKVGFDLAHAIGNVDLKLHEWNVDFACWCSYKYLNSGPGGVSGIFIHEKYSEQYDLPRFAGWWGNDESTRFLMKKDFFPQKGAAGWQLSNAQILPLSSHLASLEIFDKVGMSKLIEKSKKLTGFLYFLLSKNDNIIIITPKNIDERGCQISIKAKIKSKILFEFLKKNGVIADYREPDIIRVAPVPLYNKFEDVYNFALCINEFYSIN